MMYKHGLTYLLDAPKCTKVVLVGQHLAAMGTAAAKRAQIILEATAAANTGHFHAGVRHNTGHNRKRHL